MTIQKTQLERIEALESAVKNIMTKEELQSVMRETMSEVLLTAGKTTKGWILTIAVVLGALAVISGSIKWFLGAIGFTYIGLAK